jgi:hypothetical protein
MASEERLNNLQNHYSLLVKSLRTIVAKDEPNGAITISESKGGGDGFMKKYKQCVKRVLNLQRKMDELGKKVESLK